MQMFVLLLTMISSVFATDYFCPIEANGWTLVDNQTGQIYQWNWNSKTNEFNRDLPVIELSRRYHVVCLDINEKMYEAILINRKQFSLNWICDYEKNEGQMEIQSWLFDEEFSPKKIVFQIQNFYHVELFEMNEKKTIRIPFGTINEIVDYVSFRKNSSAYFYELVLDYGDRSGLTTVHLRPIFEEQFYIVRLSAHHNNETFVTIQCSFMYVNRIVFFRNSNAFFLLLQ